MSERRKSSSGPKGPKVFRDRAEAGDALAETLATLDLVDPLILGMARGGVPVASRIARRLGGRGSRDEHSGADLGGADLGGADLGAADLDVIVSRKIGAPNQPELAIGAVAENGVVLIERAAMEYLGVGDTELEAMVSSAQTELARRVALYRGDNELREVAGRQVVVVDDGIATGYTARAALDSVLESNPARLVLAVPVCPRAAIGQFNDIELVCLSHPHPFDSVGRWYEHFDQVDDEEVLQLLEMPSQPDPRRYPDQAT
ncbi:MAG: phosphoribosyltransferase family protein [Microthrixaceae bacterium]